jgi:hypothetical protein
MAKSEIEGVELALLQQYIDTGRAADMPPEILQYLNELELVRGQLQRFEKKESILSLLKSPPYSLSDYLARQRYNDAINFFYIDNSVKRDAWRTLYADKLDKIALTMLYASKSSRDLKDAASIFVEAAKMRGVFDVEPESLPESLFIKPVRIYTTDITQLGHEKINRIELARMIDSYQIDESSRERIRQEATLSAPKFLVDEKAAR